MRALLAPFCFLLLTITHAQSIISSSGGGDGGGLLALPLRVVGQALDPDLLMNTDQVSRAWDLEPRVYFGLGGNLQQANVVGGTLENERSVPWLGGSVEVGTSLTYRDHLGLAVQGSWGLTGYLLWPQDTICYPIYHTSKRAEARLWWTFEPRKAASNSIKVGVAFGQTFQQHDVLERDVQGSHIQTTARSMVRPYVAPEIGLVSAEGRDRMEYVLRYVKHVDGRKAFTSIATSAAGDATYDASDDHLAMVVRYHFGFKHRPIPPPAMPAVDRTDRSMDTLIVLDTRADRIVLHLRDNAEVDGDTMSVLHNGRPLLTAHALTRRPVRVRVDLEHGSNEVLFVAHNEGTVPPNTASCTVRRGRGKEELLVRTSRKKDQVVVIERR